MAMVVGDNIWFDHPKELAIIVHQCFHNLTMMDSFIMRSYKSYAIMK